MLHDQITFFSLAATLNHLGPLDWNLWPANGEEDLEQNIFLQNEGWRLKKLKRSPTRRSKTRFHRLRAIQIVKPYWRFHRSTKAWNRKKEVKEAQDLNRIIHFICKECHTIVSLNQTIKSWKRRKLWPIWEDADFWAYLILLSVPEKMHRKQNGISILNVRW